MKTNNFFKFKNTFSLAAIGLGVLLLNTGVCAPQDFAVSGMKLDQNVDEIKVSMKKYKTDPDDKNKFKQNERLVLNDLEWNELPGVPKSIATVWGSVVGPDVSGAERIWDKYDRESLSKDYLQATFGQTTGKAYLIIRRVGEFAGEEYTPEDFIKTLTSKYGEFTEQDKPLTKTGGYWILKWSYDKNGKPIKNCGGHLNKQYLFKYESGKIVTNCGITLYVNMHLNEKNIVNSYNIHLADESAILKDWEEIDRRVKEAKLKEQNIQKDAHKGLTPNL